MSSVRSVGYISYSFLISTLAMMNAMTASQEMDASFVIVDSSSLNRQFDRALTSLLAETAEGSCNVHSGMPRDRQSSRDSEFGDVYSYGIQVVDVNEAHRNACVQVGSGSVLHLVPDCLLDVERGWTSLPVVSVPDEGSPRGMKLLAQRDGVFDQLDVFGALASRFGWKSTVYVGDQAAGLQEYLTNSADHRALRDTKIAASDLSSQELAADLLSTKADALFVHCDTKHCYGTVKQTFVQLLEHPTPTGLLLYCMVTGSFARKVYVDPFWQSLIDLAEDRYQLMLLKRVSSGDATVTDGLWEVASAVNAYQRDDSQIDPWYIYDTVHLFSQLSCSEHHPERLDQQRGTYSLEHFSSAGVETVGTYSADRAEWLSEIRFPDFDAVSRVKRVSTNCSSLEFHGRPHFRVTTLLDKPFVLEDRQFLHGTKHKGNYTGFIIELMELLAERLNFDYTLSLVADGKYGIVDEETGTGTGMIGELLRCEADIAAAALTRSSARQKYVYFTTPFMEVGLSLFASKASAEPYSIWSFLDPFEMETWGVIVAAWIVFSGLLLIVHRISPYGKCCEDTHDVTPYTYSLYNSFWFFYTSFMQQGPEGIVFASGRLLLVPWFFFCLVITATYTANLAAFMTLQTFSSGIQSVDDLAAQTEVIYGTVHDTSVVQFLEHSPVETYHDMYEFMVNTEGAMVDSSKEGIDRVNNGSNYIFIWDDASLKYAASQQPCHGQVIGNVFSVSGYALAMSQDMSDIVDISQEILELRDEGKIDDLADTWLSGGSCGDGSLSLGDVASADRVSVNQMVGVFIILASTIGLSFVTALVERLVWYYKLKKAAADEKKVNVSNGVTLVDKQKERSMLSNTGTSGIEISEEEAAWV